MEKRIELERRGKSPDQVSLSTFDLSESTGES